MVICLLVSDSKLWEIIFEGNFSFCSPYMTRNWTFDKFNLRITSEASFKEFLKNFKRIFKWKIPLKNDFSQFWIPYQWTNYH